MDILVSNSDYSREAALQSQIDYLKSELKSQKIKVMLADNKDFSSIKKEEQTLDLLRAKYFSLLGKLNSTRSRNNKVAREVIFYNDSRKNPQLGRILNPSAYDRINPEKSLPNKLRNWKNNEFKEPLNEIDDILNKRDITYRTNQLEVVIY